MGAHAASEPHDDLNHEERSEVVVGRVTADAVNGFTYGKRLAYDWRFQRIAAGRTKVELDMLFEARSVLYIPLWDSMQHMVLNNMLSAFVARAEQLQQERTAANS